MRKSMLFSAVALLACCSLALAHGGSYTGPSGGGTPGYSGPGGGGTFGPSPGSPDPGGGGGGTTPGHGGGGTTGGGGGGTGPARPGGGRAGGAAGGARGGTTPGMKKSKESVRYEDWDWWWDLNDDRYLNLKRKIRSTASASDNKDVFLGGDVTEDPAAVTLRQIRKEILPSLIQGLKDPYFDARSGAVIALGKVGDKTQGVLVDQIKGLLADENNTVREASCLALGILGSQDVIPLLFDIANNTIEARKILGREQKDVLTRTRAFAATAIGLIGNREGFGDEKVIERLLEMVKSKGAEKDLQLGPALALQLVKSQQAVPQMLEILRDEEQDEYIRAHIGIALGKIGAKAAIPDLIKFADHKKTHIARSAVIALGLLASREDDDVQKVLMNQARGAADRATKNFAIIALGEQGHPRGYGWLMNQAESAKVIHDKSFSALALGIYGFKFGEGKAEAGAMLLDDYKKQRSDDKKAPLAIALGLLGYEPAMPTLREDLDRGGSQELKGHLCTALGLLVDREAIPAIQKLVAQKGDTDLRKRASIALGLMGDTGAVEILRKVIEESGNSKGVLGAATVALGFVGDSRAIPILADMVKNPDQRHQDVTRAFATVALGYLGDKDDIPILSKVHENSNYLAQTDALSEILTIL